MSVQKQYSKPSYFAFCPAAPLVVAGTAVYGHLDEALASQPVLEILSMDLAKPGLEIPRIGASVPLKSSLLSVEWGSFGIASKKSKYGILAGSLSSGEVLLWDPMAIVNQTAATPAIHTWKPSENGQVNSLAFNPHTPSMLACGTSAGEVLLYDISNPHEPRDALASPDAAPSGVAVPYAPQFRSGPGEVLSLKFNNVSPHIIAIGFANGATHLYDTRNRKKVLEFVDENLPRRIAGVAWAPSDETHLVVASEDDRSPTLQFWDLRKVRAPTLEFVGHSRGVTDVNWCPQDTGLLLSCGKDAQSIVWDTRSGERLGCLHANEPGPSIQVGWSPLSHGMFLSSQAGKGIHMAHYTGIACSFEAVTDPTSGQLVSQRVSRPLPKAPAWMKRRAVARFGFGGKLAVAKPPMSRDSVRAVSVRTLTLEPELKAHSEAFEEAISGDLRSYCQQKAHMEADPEREYWSFIEVLLGSDEERLPEMLSRLGFANEVSAVTRPGASEQVENVTAILGASSMLSSENNTHAQPEDGTRPFFDVDNLGTSPRTATGGGGNTPMGGGPTSFFDNLGATNAATPTAASGRGGASANIGQALSIGDSGALEGEAEGETDLQRHLFVGNHSAAVTTCLSHDRLADALVVAHVSNDPALWRSTLSRYMELCPQPYLRVVEAQMREDYESLIKTRPVGRWAETAAILLTYVPQPDFKRLCTKLAKRLDESGMRHAAALCYICCADVDAAVTLWLSEATDASLPVPRLQSVLEKSISLCLAAAHQAATASLADLLANYALRLVEQGAMRSAITYLSLLDQLPTDSAPSLAVLKDRVSQCSPSDVPEGIQPAIFPYEYVLVPTSVQGSVAQQEVYAAYAAQQQQYDYSQQYSAPSSATSQYPANNNYGGYGAANTGASAYSQYKYDPSGSYGQDQSYLNQQYTPAEPKPPANAPQHHGYAPQQPAQQSPYSTASRGSSMRAATPAQPAAHSYAPQAPKPVAQTSMPAPYHQPQHHPTPAKPATQYAPRPSPSPQPYSPSSRYSQHHQAPVADVPPQKQPAVFQPMHAQAPRHTMTPQPPAPAPQPAAPPAPAAPPPPPPGPPADCSIYNVDTSTVSGPAQQVVQNLYSLFQACEPLAQHALQQREMEDNAKKLGILFWKLNAHEISEEVLGLLGPLAQALTAGDIPTAKSIHVKLTGSHWSECSQWLQVIKRLMKARQQLQ